MVTSLPSPRPDSRQRPQKLPAKIAVPQLAFRIPAMPRFLLLLFLTTAPLLSQSSCSPSHRRAPTPVREDESWVAQVNALESHARQILKTELSRKLDSACD